MTNKTKNSHYQSDWAFNLVLKLAVAVCLGTLALALMMGVGPLTSLLRSGIAFATFASLAWATSLVWPESEIEKATTDQAEAEDKPAEIDRPAAAAVAEPAPLNNPIPAPVEAATASAPKEAEPLPQALAELEPAN